MRILYFEPFCGISGDMMLGALLDLGVDLEYLRGELGRLPMDGYRLTVRRLLRAGIEAVKVDVVLDAEPAAGPAGEGHGPHRSFADIRVLIAGSGLSDRIKARAIGVFERLAVVEGRVHGVPPEAVHFHEVGAVDSIVDIVGSVIGLERLSPDRIESAPVNVGSGTVRTRHGVYPVPAPATQELLGGIPTFANDVDGELTTPTGAAIVAAFAEGFGPRPRLQSSSAGYGAGARDIPGAANVLRLVLGTGVDPSEAISAEQEVAVIEAAIDDMSPQVYGYFHERVLAEGALDVYASQVLMKKNRPGFLVTVVAAEADLDRLARLVFAETTTIGLRYSFWRRRTLERRFVEVTTEFGKIRVKVSMLDGRSVNHAPEFEDCRRLARATGVALKEVQAAASRAYLSSCAGGR